METFEDWFEKTFGIDIKVYHINSVKVQYQEKKSGKTTHSLLSVPWLVELRKLWTMNRRMKARREVEKIANEEWEKKRAYEYNSTKPG